MILYCNNDALLVAATAVGFRNAPLERVAGWVMVVILLTLELVEYSCAGEPIEKLLRGVDGASDAVRELPPEVVISR